MDRYLVVMLGGAVGSLARYVIATAIMTATGGGRYPWGTFLVNISGSFLIGFAMTLLTQRIHPQPHPNWQLGLVVGVLGGYTTFSSFEWETFGLMRSGSAWMALMNVVGSVVFGLIAVWLGLALARRY